MATLFDISQRYNNLVELVDDESIPQADVNAALMAVQDELQAKGENCVMYLKRIDDCIAQAKANKKKLDAYIKAMESRKKRIADACIYALDTMQVKSILTGWGELKTKKNPPAVVIDDMSAIPSQYMRQKIEILPDKVAIKEAIQDGKTIEGAHLEQGISLSY